MDIEVLQKYSEESKLEGSSYRMERGLLAEVVAGKGREYVGLIGPRGAGKTVALKQIAAQNPHSFYLSVDTLERHVDLFKLIQEILSSYKPNLILLDEIHYNRNANKVLKNIYDFLKVKIIFSSSVAIGMIKSAHDLSRRVRLVNVPYFSFLEYLEVSHKTILPKLNIKSLLAGNVPAEYLAQDYLFDEYIRKGICPFSSDVNDLKTALENILKRIIYEDIPQLGNVTHDDVSEIERIIRFIGRSGVDGINPTSVAKNCGLPRSKAEKYIKILEKSFLLQQVWPLSSSSSNVLKEAKILMIPPFRQVFISSEELLDSPHIIGGLREDYVAWSLQRSGIEFTYLKSTRGKKCPDFLVEINNKKYIIEVGGKNKGRSQFKGLSEDVPKVILKAGSPYSNNVLPIWVLGCV